MIYKIVAAMPLTATQNILTHFRTIQSHLLERLTGLEVHGNYIQYVRSSDSKPVCDLTTKQGQTIVDIIKEIETTSFSSELFSACQKSVKGLFETHRQDKVKHYGNQLMYKVAYHRNLHNGVRLIEKLKESGIPSYEIATTLWFYLRIQRSVLAELMDSNHQERFSCTRHSEMNSLFPVNSPIQEEVKSLFQGDETRFKIECYTNQGLSYTPTTLEKVYLVETNGEAQERYRVVDCHNLDDEDKNKEIIEAVHATHHFPEVQHVFDSFKHIESVLDQSHDSLTSATNLFYFYWQQIHLAPLKRGTSAIAEMTLKICLMEADIPFQHQSGATPLDYQALASSPNKFINLALQHMCPDLISDNRSVYVCDEIHENNSLQLRIPQQVSDLEDHSTDSIEKQCHSIQQFFINRMDNFKVELSYLFYLNDFAPHNDSFVLKLDPKDHSELNRIFQDIEHQDPVLDRLQSIDHKHNDSQLNIATQMILFKSGELLQRIKHYTPEKMVKALWYYLRIQTHILSALTDPGVTHATGSNRTKVIYEEYPKGARITDKALKKIGRSKNKQVKIEFKAKGKSQSAFPTTISQFQSGEDEGVVAIRHKKGLNQKIDLFRAPIDILNKKHPSKKIAQKLFKFYQLQVHNAEFTQGTEMVSELFVRTLFNRFNIHHIPHSSDYHFKLEALTLSPKEFVSRAIRHTTPDMAASCFF